MRSLRAFLRHVRIELLCCQVALMRPPCGRCDMRVKPGQAERCGKCLSAICGNCSDHFGLCSDCDYQGMEACDV